MKKFEFHLHTGNTSYCALVPPVEIPAIYKGCGYDGIIVTDHYMQYVLDRFGETNFKAKIDNFLAGYRTVKEEAEKIGLTVWLGCELNLEKYNVEHMPAQEYLLYGEKLEEVLYSTPYLNKFDQTELFELCEENKLMMFQAHPFRQYCTRGNPDFMHGIEVFNANPRHESNNGLALGFAREHKLFKVSGGDFHMAGDEGRAGMFLPDEVKTIDDALNAIREKTATRFIGD